MSEPFLDDEVSVQDGLGRVPTFIDLFSGCGGFTLGMSRAGFGCVAAIDWDPIAVATLRENLPQVSNIICENLTTFHPADLAEHVGLKSVDIIVGGPPCQGFSAARQVDGSNHGARLVADSRRYLYQDFLRYVAFFQPRVFVIENVLGLRSAAGGQYLTRVQHEARVLGRTSGNPGYRVHGQVEVSSQLGVPQKRRRQLIVGVRSDIQTYFPPSLRRSRNADPDVLPLGIAIGDLPMLRAGGGSNEGVYDIERRKVHLRKYGGRAKKYLFRVLEVQRAKTLTNHVARPHSHRDLRDFSLLREGESSAVAMRDRGVKFEFPYDVRSFKDRYTRQSRSAPCSTIVAHLSKDGLMFIHPTQNRSLTPREAARIQSFPDWFRFPAARTHAFRLIGNAVPPLVSEAVGNTVKEFLDAVARCETDQRATAHQSRSATARATPALPKQVTNLLRLDSRSLRSISRAEFRSAWHALLAALPDLHPKNALDHGQLIQEWPESDDLLPELALSQRGRFARSGWPVALTAIGREAWRRHQRGLLDVEDIYPDREKPQRSTEPVIPG
jgi:DNA (cytosine-5)-methyltransferase 1